MFHYAEVFNQNLGNWDVSAVKDIEDGSWTIPGGMEGMFEKAYAFNQNLASWCAAVSVPRRLRWRLRGHVASTRAYGAYYVGAACDEAT